MDKYTFNKIAGSVLSALLVIVASRVFVDILYPTGRSEPGTFIQVTQTPVTLDGEAVAVADAAAPAEPAATAAAPAAALPALLAQASIEAGQASARKCSACHVWEKGGPNRIGPNLYGVVGADIAHVTGFAYSNALQEKSGEWSFEALDAFLENPRGWAPGTKMAFAGIPDPKERANLIAFLNLQSDAPLPLPAADAAPAAPANGQQTGEAPAQAAPAPAQAEAQAAPAQAPQEQQPTQTR